MKPLPKGGDFMGEKRRDKGEGSIYFRESDKRWVAKYVATPGSKPKVLYGKIEQEVKKKLREYKKEIIKNDYVEVQKITVKDYMENWLFNVKIHELKPKSFDRMEVTLNNQIYPHIGDYQIDVLTANDVQVLINKLVVKKLSYSTIKKTYDCLNACFKLGVIKDELIKNPCIGVSLPKNTKKQSGVKFFTIEQAELISVESVRRYKTGKPVYRLGHGINLLLYTGMRIGEALYLSWDDVDFENKTLWIRGNVELVKNRDESINKKQVLIRQDNPKTDAGIRIIHINQKAITALQGLKELNGNQKYLFSTGAGNIILPPNLNFMLKGILKKCGIPSGGVHTLRHAYVKRTPKIFFAK